MKNLSRVSFKIGRNKEAVEKCVLPTIVFINTNHKSFTDLRRKGFMLALGWWDWSAKIIIIL